MITGTTVADNPVDKQTVIRKYGLLEPYDWADDCDQELGTMDAFWNKLVSIHEEHSASYYDLILTDTALRMAKERFEDLIAIDIASSEAQKAKRELAILQREVQKKFADPLQKLEFQRREKVKIARQQSGLWWGNYNAVVRAFEVGRRTAVRAGNAMQKRVAPVNGRFTNQIIGGAPVARIFDGSLSQIYVRPLTAAAWEGGTRGDRRRLQRTTLTATIFVREGERRNVTWPMVMHRPIPSDCTVKEVVVTRRMIAGRAKWAVTFICSRPSDRPVPRFDVSLPTAVDVGWRVVPEGLRIATVLHPHSEPRFIVLDQALIASFTLVNELKAKLRQSAAEGIAILEEHRPEIVSDDLRNILRSSRVEAIDKITIFRDLRNDASRQQIKPVFVEKILAWRLRHRRIACWLIGQQRKVVARRNHLYQNAAADIARSASSVLVSDLNLGRISHNRSNTEPETFFPRRARYYQNVAAVSELIRWIGIQCGKHGVPIEKRQLRSPLPCPECGSLARATRADALVQTCEACGTSWDQDVVACRLLVDSWTETHASSDHSPGA